MKKRRKINHSICLGNNFEHFHISYSCLPPRVFKTRWYLSRAVSSFWTGTSLAGRLSMSLANTFIHIHALGHYFPHKTKSKTVIQNKINIKNDIWETSALEGWNRGLHNHATQTKNRSLLFFSSNTRIFIYNSMEFAGKWICRILIVFDMPCVYE